jgi:hypothetical protein
MKRQRMSVPLFTVFLLLTVAQSSGSRHANFLRAEAQALWFGIVNGLSAVQILVMKMVTS